MQVDWIWYCTSAVFQEIQKGGKKFRFTFYFEVIQYVVWCLWRRDMRFILNKKKFMFSRTFELTLKSLFPSWVYAWSALFALFDVIVQKINK